MPWGEAIPPPPVPAPVAGWFAIINILAQHNITINNAATAMGLIGALQSMTIVNAASAKGFQAAANPLIITDAATPAGVIQVVRDFSIIDAASLIGKPGAANPLVIDSLASVLGFVLSPQQFNLLNVGSVTGFEGTLSGAEFVTIADAATVAGIRAAGQDFTVVNGAALAGKLGAGQVMAFTDAATVLGVSAASVNFIVTNVGDVYATPAAGQSFTLVNSAAAVDATIHGPTFIGYSNGATGSAISCQVGDMIVGFGFGTTAPTLPVGWTNIANANLTGYGVRFGYKIATATTDPTAVWTGSSGRVMYVFRNCTGMGATATSAATAAALTMIYPALNLTVLTGTSMLLRIGHRASLGTLSSTSNTPPGYTNAAAAVPYGSYLSGPTANEVAWTTPSFGNSSVYKTITVELLG